MVNRFIITHNIFRRNEMVQLTKRQYNFYTERLLSKVCLCPGSTVVEHLTHNPKVKVSNPATDADRQTMAKSNCDSPYKITISMARFCLSCKNQARLKSLARNKHASLRCRSANGAEERRHDAQHNDSQHTSE